MCGLPVGLGAYRVRAGFRFDEEEVVELMTELYRPESCRTNRVCHRTAQNEGYANSYPSESSNCCKSSGKPDSNFIGSPVTG